MKPLPNLFFYATKELSQDAFICWLLAWGDPDFAGENPDLHRCARAVLSAFYGAAGRTVPPDIRDVTIHRQYHKIDVLVKFQSGDERFAVLIEDKVGTDQHSDQLLRYRDILRKEGYSDENVLCIFFKTFDQCDYASIKAAGFHVFDRGALLGALRPFADVGNAILQDFYRQMRALEDAVEAFRRLPLGEWKPRDQCWVGFYRALHEHVPAAEWAWVNNAAGGYWGCWWGLTSGATPLYFQLREERAAVCLAVPDADAARQQELRDQWQPRVLKLAGELGLPLQLPKNMRLGKNMTIATVQGDYRQADGNGQLDLAATAAFLRRFDEFGQTISQRTDLRQDEPVSAFHQEPRHDLG